MVKIDFLAPAKTRNKNLKNLSSLISEDLKEKEKKGKIKKRSLDVHLTFLTLICSLILSLFTPQILSAGSVSIPPAPTVLSPLQGQLLSTPAPLIKGLTKNNTTVDIYIDGVFNGRARVKEAPSGTANFAYFPFLLLKAGTHTLYTKARSTLGPRVSSASLEISFTILPYPAPILSKPVVNQNTVWSRPFITGLARNDSKVKVFIDGILNGEFQVENHPSGTAHFAYQPFLDLSVGSHRVYAISQDKEGKQSVRSLEASFIVESSYPRPILYSPEVNNKTTYKKPFIVGLAKNDSLVKVFIDGILNGEFQVENHPSGTAHFAYQPFLDLLPGQHEVYTRAIDKNGKESQPSNKLNFTVSAPKIVKTQELGIGGPEEKELLLPREKEIIPPKVETEREPEEITIPEEEKEIILEEGRIETEEEARGKIIEEEVVRSKFPLVVGIITLVLIIVAFLSWYIGKKKEALSKKIKDLFIEETEMPKPEKRREEVEQGKLELEEKEKPKREEPSEGPDEIPPPPPAT